MQRLSSAVMAGLLLGALAWSGAAPARADGGLFSASATASGGRLSLISPGAPASDTPMDGGGPIAEANLDSLGIRRAFASLPYPGDVFIGNASAVPGIVPGAPAPPAYPFYAAADSEKPEQTVGFGIVQLHAKTDATRSAAEGAVGMGKAAMREASEASVDAPANGNIVAHAAQRLEGVVMGPLRIAEVAATAEVALTPAGVRTRRTSFTMNGITVAGRPVDFAGGRFSLPGTASAATDTLFSRPAADPPPGGDNPLQPFFDRAGLRVTIVPDRETESGVVTGGLEIRTGGAMPNGSSGTLVLVLGQVTASVAGDPASPADVGAVIEPGPTTAATPNADPGAGDAGDGTEPSDLPSPATAARANRSAPVDAASLSGPVALPGTTPAPPVPPAAGKSPSDATPAPATTALFASGVQRPVDGISHGLYGALALGALGFISVIQFLRVGRVPGS